MAEPGDPQTPIQGQMDDHDDLIGFTSPSSLAGAKRRPATLPDVPVEPIPSDQAVGHGLFDGLESRVAAAPEQGPASSVEAASEPASDDLGPLFTTPTPTAPIAPPPPPQVAPVAANMDFDAPPAPEPAPIPGAAPISAALPVPPRTAPTAAPAPERSRETTSAPKAASASAFGRSRRAESPEDAMGLYAVYALILFAVPTLGVSALIALFAVTGRPGPSQPLARSHFLFQQRTLWIAAVVVALGVVLIAVNLGVFVLVVMALWVLVRGAAGVVRLSSGRPIKNPKTLLI